MGNPVIKYLLHNQFIAALLLIVAGWFVIEIRGILIAIFISYIVMAALSPLVDFLISQKVPKVLSVFIAYLTTLSILVILIFPLVPFFVSQIQALFNGFPVYFDRAARLLGINFSPNQINSLLTSQLGLIGSNAFTVTGKVLGGLFTIITILAVSFYMLLDRDRIKKNTASLFPDLVQAKVVSTITRIEDRLGAWLRGQIILSVFIGVITFIALSVLGLEFALPLAVLAGILEIIPTIGPIISAVPAIIVSLAISPTMTLIVILVYIGIQMIENNVLVPKIMQRAVGLSPLTIIVGIMIGGKFLGIIGALLSIPFISMLVIIFNSLRSVEENLEHQKITSS